MLDALREDMGKPRFDALVYELEYIITDLKCTISKLHKWMTPFKVSVNIAI